MYKITTGEGSAFFIRPDYLQKNKVLSWENVTEGKEFFDSEEEEILDAAFATAAERKAVEFLSRSEHSKSALIAKLEKKGHLKKACESAVLYLEEKNYVSDKRFSVAWLNSRKTFHFEGKSKLISQLQSRGIEREIAENAVKEFFLENDENEICKKALLKMVKKGKKDEKLLKSLLDAGFSFKMAKSAIKEFEKSSEN